MILDTLDTLDPLEKQGKGIKGIKGIKNINNIKSITLLMTNTKSVRCPNCGEWNTLAWWVAVGVFKGTCTRCKKIIYARDGMGRVWINQDLKQECRAKLEIRHQDKRR